VPVPAATDGAVRFYFALTVTTGASRRERHYESTLRRRHFGGVWQATTGAGMGRMYNLNKQNDEGGE
jgi:hypothetical protein